MHSSSSLSKEESEGKVDQKLYRALWFWFAINKPKLSKLRCKIRRLKVHLFVMGYTVNQREQTLKDVCFKQVAALPLKETLEKKSMFS
ncbi:hypothetical protein P8452_58025 [Trifolium repens]|nr:hypothetical protein P8452_58025 [Trifolium repens]